ncbi:MAG: aminotransferase class I/II-fold pyridoxal phosphate-dependent enzyme [Actinobacteria bacterium]|nr:aminotransferase class I/II-fold pyridoxal phosphate-dependent enzyme [Actinomycetota bacterium]
MSKIPPPLAAYQWPPATDELAERVGLAPDQMLRFDGNVPPQAPVTARPATIARALADVNEYDRGRYAPLREDIATYHGVEANQIVLGAGSDELIVLCARIFASGGTIATVPSNSYSMYRFAAGMAGATVIDDPSKADLVFVCRPNNPTGELPDIPTVPGQLVIDEAYADYAGVSAIDQVDNGVIVLRTFSKAFGLAGARVGYSISTPQLADAMAARLAPLSVSTLSAALARAALASPPDVSSQIAERERLSVALSELGFTPLKSFTNFLYIPMEDPESVVNGLLPYGIVVRAFAGALRISVRDELDDNRLLEAIVAWQQGIPPSSVPTIFRRATAETSIAIRLRIPGEGRVFVDTGQGFYDHMLQQLAFHSGMDLRLEGVGDHETGDHHTVEDMMRAFGDAFSTSLGDRKGIARYGESRVPMDEALAHAVVDLSGRPTATISITPDPGMATHALESFVQTAKITLHVTATGQNAHHVSEAAFKAVGRALAEALRRDGGLIRSTKGSL